MLVFLSGISLQKQLFWHISNSSFSCALWKCVKQDINLGIAFKYFIIIPTFAGEYVRGRPELPNWKLAGGLKITHAALMYCICKFTTYSAIQQSYLGGSFTASLDPGFAGHWREKVMSHLKWKALLKVFLSAIVQWHDAQECSMTQDNFSLQHDDKATLLLFIKWKVASTFERISSLKGIWTDNDFKRRWSCLRCSVFMSWHHGLTNVASVRCAIWQWVDNGCRPDNERCCQTQQHHVGSTLQIKTNTQTRPTYLSISS